jgi:very-short-patch-repair endonuclease
MRAEFHLHRPGDGKRESRRLGRAIAALAAYQYGVVSRQQLRALGARDDQIDGWIAAGRLVPIHRGVYSVGHRLRTVQSGWMAGVLAGGPDAVLSHRSAADHWELTGLSRSLADVTVRRNRRSRAGLRFHRSLLPEDERTEHEGIAVTTVARTLLDLASVESPARLRKAIAVADARLLADATPLPELIERYPGRPGLAKLRSALAVVTAGDGVAHRALELRFAEFIDARQLPRPQMNVAVRVDGRTFVVDCLWPEAGLVVELDSRKHHADWEAAESDRARDLALLSIGLRVARVTWRRLAREADALDAELRSILAVHDHRP